MTTYKNIFLKGTKNLYRKIVFYREIVFNHFVF